MKNTPMALLGLALAGCDPEVATPKPAEPTTQEAPAPDVEKAKDATADQVAKATEDAKAPEAPAPDTITLTTTPEAMALLGKNMYVTEAAKGNQGLNLRSMPNGTKADNITGKLPVGTEVTVLLVANNDWVHVMFKDAEGKPQVGWVAFRHVDKTYLTLDAPVKPEVKEFVPYKMKVTDAVTKAEGLKLRDKPNGAVLVKIPAGTEVQVTGEDGTDWVNVEVTVGGTAYRGTAAVRLGAETFLTKVEPAPTKVLTAKDFEVGYNSAVVVYSKEVEEAGGAALRTKPDSTDERNISKRLLSGTKLQVLKAEGQEWLEVQTNEGERGYVAVKNLNSLK